MDSGTIPSVRLFEVIFQGSEVNVSRTILDPGQEVPWHSHTSVSDVFYAVSGILTITTQDPAREEYLVPGATYRVNAKHLHRVLNAGSEPAEYILVQGIGPYDFVAADA